jgi:hypothetical protein
MLNNNIIPTARRRNVHYNSGSIIVGPITRWPHHLSVTSIIYICREFYVQISSFNDVLALLYTCCIRTASFPIRRATGMNNYSVTGYPNEFHWHNPEITKSWRDIAYYYYHKYTHTRTHRSIN